MADCVMVAMNGPKVDPETGVKIEAGVLDAGRVEVSAERYSMDLCERLKRMPRGLNQTFSRRNGSHVKLGKIFYQRLLKLAADI